LNTNIVAAGINIVIISAVSAVYGLYESNAQILGVGLSGVLLGLALIGIGTSTHEGSSRFFEEALRVGLNGLASVQEVLDLVEYKLAVVGGAEPKIVLSRRGEEVNDVDPGIGVSSGAPYISIPLSNVLTDVAALDEVTETSLRNSLYDHLVEELSVCRALDVELSGGNVKITVSGLDEKVRPFTGYPVSPLTLLLAALLYRLTGRSLRLLEHGRLVDGAYWVFRILER
jgi:hypothetical protein